MSFTSLPSVSERRAILLGHPFLNWAAAGERTVRHRDYGTDIYLSPSASRRLQIGWDRFGNITLAVNTRDEAAFRNMRWVGAALVLEATPPKSDNTSDWVLLVADTNLHAVIGDESTPDPRSILGIWLPAGLNKLHPIAEHAKRAGGHLTGTRQMRIMSINEDINDPQGANVEDIASLRVVLMRGGECFVPYDFTPNITPPAPRIKPENKTKSCGKTKFRRTK